MNIFLSLTSIAYKGMAVERVRLQLGDSKGPALADKRKTLNDYSKSYFLSSILNLNTVINKINLSC